jgi:hypothetical protein
MAKSKRSRRVRRQATPKPTPSPATPQPIQETTASTPTSTSKIVDFATEYYYVFFEMRNVLIIGVLMFAVLIGLSFAL